MKQRQNNQSTDKLPYLLCRRIRAGVGVLIIAFYPRGIGIGLVIQSVYYQPLVIRNLKPLEATNNST